VTVPGADEEGCVATQAREVHAVSLEERIPGAVYLRQAHNPANAEAYMETLALEVWQATAVRFDVLVGAIGTGGSLSRTARK
jgi:cysteine synthase A